MQRCCPKGYTYVYADGSFYNPLTATTGVIGNPSPANVGKCMTVVNLGANLPWAVPPTPSPIETIGCPCCPEGYTYDSIYAQCERRDLKDVTPRIPCLACACVTVIRKTCGTCGPDSLPVSFSFDFFSRQCSDCHPEDGVTPKGTINKFLATNLINPPINFVLKNKNSIE